jgi:hypothetical protein
MSSNHHKKVVKATKESLKPTLETKIKTPPTKRGEMKYHPEFDQSLIEVDNIDDANRVLDQYGVCIVKNLLNEQECEGIRDGMAQTLEHLTANMRPPFKYENKKTWSTLDNLLPKKHMMYQHYGVGQAQFFWDLRCNPKVINAFASLWGTDDLLVSFDGFSFHLPPETLGKGYESGAKSKWWHVDQSFQRIGKACIQGLVNGNDTNIGDATLTVLVGSHNCHESYGKDNNVVTTKDWYLLPSIDYYIEKGCPEHRISCPRGSLVLWDSRTVHYGAEPLKYRPEPNLRTVCYVCYTPRNLITEEKRKDKISYFETMRVTNHWPHAPEPFAVKASSRHRKSPTDVNPLPPPVVPKEYYSLIGYNPGEY